MSAPGKGEPANADAEAGDPGPGDAETRDAAPVRDLLPIADRRQTWAAVRVELRRMRWLSAAALATTVLGNAAGLVAPWVLGDLVDDVTDGAGAAAIWRGAAVIAAAALLGGLVLGVGMTLTARIGETVLARLRERVVDRALHLPAARLERAGSGDLLARVGDDVAVVADATSNVVPPVLGASLTIVLTGGGLAALDWRLGLAGLAAVPLYVVALRWYLPRSGPLYAEERVAMGERAQALVSSLHGAGAVRAFRLERRRINLVTARSAAAMGLSMRVFALFTRFSARNNRAECVGLALVLAVGFVLVRADLVTIGMTTAAALYFHRLFNPMNVILFSFDEVQSAGASLARLVGVSDLPATSTPESAAGRTPARADRAIVVRDVSHRYDDGPFALDGVSLQVRPGERVALVGASGAGKSTLAGIVAGLLEPTAGTVTVGGTERRRVALLSQEVHVFSGPLADDLRLAAPEAGDDELREALAAVGAAGWVDALPEGMATRVGESAHRLTAAQAQQVALARLLLADPEFAVLDEATAEAGSAGAHDLERAALAATEGRTTLVVAHRLTQAVSADRVVVLDKGRVIESGTHAELVAAGGGYAQLWATWRGRADQPG